MKEIYCIETLSSNEFVYCTRTKRRQFTLTGTMPIDIRWVINYYQKF